MNLILVFLTSLNNTKKGWNVLFCKQKKRTCIQLFFSLCCMSRVHDIWFWSNFFVSFFKLFRFQCKLVISWKDVYSKGGKMNILLVYWSFQSQKIKMYASRRSIKRATCVFFAACRNEDGWVTQLIILRETPFRFPKMTP